MPDFSDVDRFLQGVNSPFAPKLLISLLLASCLLPALPFFVEFSSWSYRGYVPRPWRKLRRKGLLIAVSAHALVWMPWIIFDMFRNAF